MGQLTASPGDGKNQGVSLGFFIAGFVVALLLDLALVIVYVGSIGAPTYGDIGPLVGPLLILVSWIVTVLGFVGLYRWQRWAAHGAVGAYAWAN